MSTEVDWDAITSGGYRGRLLNWETWVDGKSHLLWQGDHFRGRVDSARSAGRQWADRHGYDVRTAIITPSSDDTLIALTTDLEALSDQLSHGEEIEDIANVVLGLAERARDLVPRFAWHVVGMKDGSPLSDDVVALAKRLQAQRGELSDEARRELRSHRRGPEPEVPDPIERRKALLSDQLSDGEGREVLRSRRADPRGKRAKRSDQAAQGG